MDLTTLSASSAHVFEDCAARWAAEYGLRARQPSGSPAALGNTCHSVAQEAVELGLHLQTNVDDMTIKALYDVAYWENFSDTERYDEGWEMVLGWWKRTDWSGRTVLSTEQKLNFPIKTSIGEIPFNYIFDRCDELDNGEIEVIDYKTWMAPVRPETMKKKIQVRAYGLAAAFQFPDAPRVWITLDQWRHEPVSCSFSRAENIDTWKYIKAMCERIIAMEPDEDGKYPESLNVDCRYCVRRHECDAMKAHELVGGPLAITDPFAAADRRYRLESARKAMEVMIEDLDAVIMGYCADEEMMDFTTGAVDVAISSYAKRVIDPAMAARILGPLAAEFPGGLKIGVIDALMKEKPCRLTDEQRSQLKQITRKEYGDAKVKVTQADAVLA